MAGGIHIHVTMTDCDGDRLTAVVCDVLPFEALPDYDVYTAATWAIQDSIEWSVDA